MKIAVVNYGRDGKETPGKWHVRIGNKWKTFDKDTWLAGGIEWLSKQKQGRP